MVKSIRNLRPSTLPTPASSASRSSEATETSEGHRREYRGPEPSPGTSARTTRMLLPVTWKCPRPWAEHEMSRNGAAEEIFDRRVEGDIAFDGVAVGQPQHQRRGVDVRLGLDPRQRAERLAVSTRRPSSPTIEAAVVAYTGEFELDLVRMRGAQGPSPGATEIRATPASRTRPYRSLRADYGYPSCTSTGRVPTAAPHALPCRSADRRRLMTAAATKVTFDNGGAFIKETRREVEQYLAAGRTRIRGALLLYRGRRSRSG